MARQVWSPLGAIGRFKEPRTAQAQHKHKHSFVAPESLLHAGIRDTHRRLKPPSKTNARLRISIGAIIWSCFRGDKISVVSLLSPPKQPASYLIQDLPKYSSNPASPRRNPPDDRDYSLALRPSNPTKQLSSSISLRPKDGGAPTTGELQQTRLCVVEHPLPYPAEARRCSFAAIVVGTRSPLFAKPPPPAMPAHVPAPAKAEAQAPSRHSPVEVLTDNLEKPSLDDREYRVVRLENELEALLVHDPETDKASAALDVNVGNFSDEDGMPGMAHAVEHLLFMGTKKFPIENEYGQYLSANSGSSNAYTASTSTNYYFDVAAKPANDENPSATNPSPLREALDRFAQFFIEPLFLSSTLDRELKAVDSENKKNLQNDTWRLHQLDKSLSNPKHPYCHFSTGNLEVLKTIPEASGINVRDKFIEFHAKHYSANRMKLVILGREPLDVLQDWTVEFFSGIANKRLAPNRWTEELPFRENDIGVQWFAKPVMDTRELNLGFPFIDEEDLYKSQPSRYCSHLIGHEGPGSIMSYIKNKGWANSLSAGAYPICPGTPGVFEVQIRLTEEGLKVYPQIINIFFQYIALLREASPQEWIFQEQKGMADVDFKFREKTPASRFTSRVSSVMQKPLPREWLLSAHSRLRVFDAEHIEQALSKIRPENLRLSVVSRTFPGNWNLKEKWYGTEYSYGKIPEDVMEDWKRAINTPSQQRLPQLHLPHKNSFIPNKLEVEKKEVPEPALAPRILRNDAEARTWWKKDDTFWVPKANVIVSLKNPLIYASAQNSVKARLFTELVRDALEEYSYDAELAGLEYTVSLDSRGMFLDISGYNDKLLLLLKKVTSTLRDIEIREDRFAIVKERLTRGYDNWQLQSSYQQVGDYTSWLNAECDYLVEELAVELREVTSDDIRQFQKQMLAQLYTEVYVHGNMSKSDALDATEVVESTLKPRVLFRSQWPIIRSLILPPGSNYVYKKTLKDPANVNHCVETWLYVGDRGNRNIRAKTLLMDQMMHEPAFDQLRTKEQLGYIVFASIRNFATTCGFRFLIQSERTPDYLDRRIEAFLVQFGESLQKMTDTEFEGHKRSLINKRLEKLRNLDQETSRHWAQISNEYYDFEQAQHDAANAKLLTKAEMLEYFAKYFSPSSSSRARLSVHLYARGSSEVDSKIVDLLKNLGLEDVPKESRASLDLLEGHLKTGQSVSDDQRTTLLSQAKELGLPQASPKVETSSNDTSAIDAAVEITDGRQYKAGLQVSSGARPVKDLKEFEEIDPKL
ncbi:insulysin [Trichoderma gamsii]|uniref:Insulysin n=1 Tax=Trichoderma gamsii TaxID=398673 RepID=A0A2P4ZUE6_9HYPO|nr:insulysin [Trichoderma gamsii]PON27902.1 insulysin [Trichoderma gamsii]